MQVPPRSFAQRLYRLLGSLMISNFAWGIESNCKLRTQLDRGAYATCHRGLLTAPLDISLYPSAFNPIARVAHYRCSNRVPGVADELISLRYHLVRLFEKIAPDSSRFCQLRKRSSECFDGQPAIISARFDCSEYTLKIDVTTTWYTAVVVCDMDMCYLRDVCGKGLGQVLLFNVGVESVKHGLEVWMGNAANVSSRGSNCVQKVTFKSVQRLNRKPQTLTLCFLCHLAVYICSALEFFFRRTGPGEHSQSLMEWSTQNIRSENSRVANDCLQSLRCCLPDCRIGADRACFGRCDGDGGTLELQFIQLPAQFLVVRVVACEDWDFNAIESCRFDFFQVGVVLLE